MVRFLPLFFLVGTLVIFWYSEFALDGLAVDYVGKVVDEHLGIDLSVELDKAEASGF